jgi:N-acetylglucosaminyldiphosphoundecaprenol N-acetyl-beta-D-mannosaminyltransferase
MHNPTKYNFFNVDINLIETAEALKFCNSVLQEGKENKMIFFLNAHCFNIAQKNSDYLEAINNADLLLNDGIGIKIGTKILKLPHKENMNGTDFIPKVIELCIDKKRPIFLLGAKEGISDTAAETLKAKYPDINIVGNRSGYFTKDEEDDMINEIDALQTEVLIVGMGVPIQELWIYKNREKFKNVKIIIAGGAIIDFISGKVKRAPVFIQKIGLEWLFRFAQEPRRLFKRYFSGNFVYFWYVFTMLRKRKRNYKHLNSINHNT